MSRSTQYKQKSTHCHQLILVRFKSKTEIAPIDKGKSTSLPFFYKVKGQTSRKLLFMTLQHCNETLYVSNLKRALKTLIYHFMIVASTSATSWGSSQPGNKKLKMLSRTHCINVNFLQLLNLYMKNERFRNLHALPCLFVYCISYRLKGYYVCEKMVSTIDGSHLIKSKTVPSFMKML